MNTADLDRVAHELNQSRSSTGSHSSETHSAPASSHDATVLSEDDLRDGIPVIDPMNTVCSVTTAPFTLIEPTKGSLVPRRSTSGAPQQQVCLAFIQGNCNQGAQCHNIHLRSEFVRATRTVKEPLCCAHHNDYLSRHLFDTVRAPVNEQTFALTLPTGATRKLNPNRLMITVGLDRILARHKGKRNPTTQDIVIGFSSVCRLHQRGGCRWGKQCGNIHVCRCEVPGASGVQQAKVYPPMNEVVDEPAAALPTPVAPAAPAAFAPHPMCVMPAGGGFMMQPQPMHYMPVPQPQPFVQPVYYVIDPNQQHQAQVTWVQLQQ